MGHPALKEPALKKLSMGSCLVSWASSKGLQATWFTPPDFNAPLRFPPSHNHSTPLILSSCPPAPLAPLCPVMLHCSTSSLTCRAAWAWQIADPLLTLSASLWWHQIQARGFPDPHLSVPLHLTSSISHLQRRGVTAAAVMSLESHRVKEHGASK